MKINKENRKENTRIYSGSPNHPRYGVHPLFVEKFRLSSNIMLLKLQSQL